MDKRDILIQKFLTDTQQALNNYIDEELEIDTSNYFEWSRQSMMNSSKYMGHLEGLIQILKIEYKCAGGDLSD